jgi:hypothetical protein
MQSNPIKVVKEDLETALRMWDTYTYVCKLDRASIVPFPAWARGFLNTLNANISDVGTTDTRTLDLFKYTDFLFNVIWTEYGAAEAITVPEAEEILAELKRRLDGDEPDHSYFSTVDLQQALAIRNQLQRFLRK